MKALILFFSLVTGLAVADEGMFEKTQSFRAVAYGPRDEACALVSDDIVTQMDIAEETISAGGAIIVTKIMDPCLFSENMQTSMFGEITYLVLDEEPTQE